MQWICSTTGPTKLQDVIKDFAWFKKSRKCSSFFAILKKFWDRTNIKKSPSHIIIFNKWEKNKKGKKKTQIYLWTMHLWCILNSTNYFFSIEPLKWQKKTRFSNSLPIFWIQQNKPNQISFIYTFVQNTGHRTSIDYYYYPNKTILFWIQKGMVGYSVQSIQSQNLDTRKIKFTKKKVKHEKIVQICTWMNFLDIQNTSNKMKMIECTQSTIKWQWKLTTWVWIMNKC